MNLPPAGTKASWQHSMVVAVLIGAGILASYSNTFGVPFLFDDGPAIVENKSIRELGDLAQVLSPKLEGGVTTSGRPVLNLSFALNHAFGGYAVWSYHATNLVIHWLAALALFGLVRRTVSATISPAGGEVSQTMLAGAIVALWALHPLQTAAVTYIVQRAESLCALWMLLTLLSFFRATESTRPFRWEVGAVVACILGMATKEVAVVTPLLVLAFDRTFVAGSFRAAWRLRRGFYLSLAGTWLVLALILFTSNGRGTTAGFETVVTPWNYLLTQAGAIVRYLGLAVWPSPLVFDYGTSVVKSLAEVWWQAATIAILMAATAWALVRGLAIGSWGAWFFAVLAPSSSLIPIASQTVAEHRMYLPLAAVVAFFTTGAARASRSPKLVGVACLILAVAMGIGTHIRNNAYQSAASIWADTVEKSPANVRARINLAREFSSAGKDDDALRQLDRALSVDPRSADAHYNRGVILARRDDSDGAASEYEKTIQAYPRHAEALNNLGGYRLQRGEFKEAEMLLSRAIEAKPDLESAHANLSAALLELGNARAALEQAETAIRLNPKLSDGEFRRGNALLELQQFDQARLAFQHAVEIDPQNADAQNNYANLLAQAGDFDAAVDHYRTAIAMRPDFVDARRNAGMVLAHLGRMAEAAGQFEELVRLRPEEAEFRERLSEIRAHLR